MAVKSGKDASVWIDNALGSLVDITAYLTEAGFPQEPEQLETTTMGSQEKSYVGGFIGAAFSMNGRFDGAAAAIYDILATAVGASGPNSQRTVVFWPHGRPVGGTPTATQPSYTFEVVVLSQEVTTGAADIVGFTANSRVVGAVARAIA